MEEKDNPKLTIKLKDKEYKIDYTDDFKTLNNKIKAILEEEYHIKINKINNLYRAYYLDDDKDKNYIKNKEDYGFFINISQELYLEIDEKKIKEIPSEKNIELKDKNENENENENELKLLETIKELTKRNEDLKKEKDIYSEMSNIYKEKVKILEEEKKIKNEKEKTILQHLEEEKKEKNEISEQLEEAKKLNQNMSLIINNDDDNAKDILVNNLKEEKSILENQLNVERKKMDLIEKIYLEDNNKLKQKINNLQNEFDTQKQEILKKNDILIKKEVEKGINDFINKSKINLEQKENEINKIKNDYENKINSIREECYQEMEEKYSKIYEDKIKELYESQINNSKILYDNILSLNKQQFEEEEKKRNQVINSNILMKSSNNFSKISQCKTIHNNISCNECGVNPIVGYRYKCLECVDYNLCEICEKKISHEHNFVKYVNEEKKNTNIDDNYSYECLTSKKSISIYEGDSQAKLNIILKNNGYLKWSDKSLLINDKDSQIECNSIQLKPLEPNEQDNILILFDKLNNLKAGKYTSSLLFSINKKIYGKPLKIEINILEKKNN